MTRAIDYLLIALVACTVTMMCLMLAGPEFLNADTAIMSVMSIQHVTLFYWGQNRFLNLAPALASLVHRPEANLILQLLLLGGGSIAFLALLGHLMARLVLRSTKRLDAWLCFALLLLIFVAIVNRYTLHVFITEGQPYGLSYLLTGIGLFVFLTPHKTGWRRGTLAFAAMMIGGGLNPSLLVVAMAICAGTYLLYPPLRKEAVRSAILSIVAIEIWLVIGLFSQGPSSIVYGFFGIGQFLPNLAGALHAMPGSFASEGLASAIILSATAALAISIWRAPGDQPKRWWLPIALCAVFSIAWIALFAQNTWIIMNGWHFRYFYPAYICISIALAAPVAVLLKRFGSGIRSGVVIFALSAIFIMLVTPWRPLDSFRVFVNARPYVEQAKSRNIHFITGNYWSVWPSIFLMQSDGPAFGLDSRRGMGNLDGIRQEIGAIEAQHIPVRALCVEAAPQNCIDQASSLVQIRWKAVPESCGQYCSIIEVTGSK